MANKCPHCDKIPRHKWYKNTKEVYHTNFKNAINHFMSNEGTSGQHGLTSWGGLQSHMQIATCHQQEHEICEQKSIILDNGSTMSIFMIKNWFMML